MRDGYIKVAAATPELRVADIDYNVLKIYEMIRESHEEDASIIVFPELSITGYTCNDLFAQEILIEKAKESLLQLVKKTSDMKLLYVVGMPLMIGCKLYNVAVFISSGKILGIVPKTYLPNHSEFYEVRNFAKGTSEIRYIQLGDEEVPFGTNILFCCKDMPNLVLAGEICEDLWVPTSPSIMHSMAGATVICNLSASDETIRKKEYRRSLVSGHSAKLMCGYIYANAGDGESSTDLVFGGHNIIAENGTVLAESDRYTNTVIYSEIDTEKIVSDRRKTTTYMPKENMEYTKVLFEIGKKEVTLIREIPRHPFIPRDELKRSKRCEEILMIQAMGLKKRLLHTNCKNVVLGLSGGLDSTLALLVVTKTFNILKLDFKGIICVTMPGFGTTDRTYCNAINLAKELGTTIKEINIIPVVNQHFIDIGHDKNIKDVTYENSQARERTQILMDIANMINGLVIGTGDMSELALGWATYNGDHMSMYGVNCSIPKTLVKYLVKFYADSEKESVKKILLDILDTPVSPELLPPTINGDISQKTEEVVGPYELHDFYLYYMMRFGFRPRKIYRLACIAFEGIYDKEIIKKWLNVFYKSFFSQQFKRSCIPDGPKVGTVSLSPRGDLKMPSDAMATIWTEEVLNL